MTNWQTILLVLYLKFVFLLFNGRINFYSNLLKFVLEKFAYMSACDRTKCFVIYDKVNAHKFSVCSHGKFFNFEYFATLSNIVCSGYSNLFTFQCATQSIRNKNITVEKFTMNYNFL